jgi:hypothetical protein
MTMIIPGASLTAAVHIDTTTDLRTKGFPMMRLHETETGVFVGTITDAPLQLLMDQLEEALADDTDDDIDHTTLDLCEAVGAEADVRSCPCSLRLIQQPDKPGKMPSLQPVYEGVLPWSLLFSRVYS